MSIEALNWAMDANIPKNPGAKLVLIVLANYADEDGFCWPSQPTISRKTGISERAIRNHLTWLENNLFIFRQHRETTKKGKYTSDLITLHFRRQNLPPVKSISKEQKTSGNQRQNLPPAKSADGKKCQYPAAESAAKSFTEPSVNNIYKGDKISSDWKPGQEVMNWLARQGVTDQQTIIDLTQEFILYFRESNERRVSWDSTFMRNPVVKQQIKNYLTKSSRVNGNGNGTGKTESGASILAAGCQGAFDSI